MKKLGLSLGLSLLVVAAGCGEHEQPEEIFNRSKAVMEDSTESLHFKQWQNLNVSGESTNINTRGATRLQPFELYMISTMDLVDFNEPLEFEFMIDGDEAYYKEDGEPTQFADDVQSTVVDMINPLDEMDRYAPFEQSMLMKEIEDYYEVSFRTDQEQHIPLVMEKMEQWGVVEEGLEDAIEDSIEIERIDMVAFIDKETYQLHQFDTRYRFLVNIQGDLHQIDDQQSLRYEYINEIDGDLETFVRWLIEEEQQEEDDEEEDEEELL
ncbi:hypothetical protein JCM19037_3560 [Geomicrobium sp. JCM 19037]|uniref:DUF6612 family protein n=1 Tax=Geomicrobium sp. JCM 19037 TaxID=1460634 RepID=UPI00045F16D4|nr:DUF6612 family protein [Geomicrobium sp. JCM 19037]GAK05091.1 hypothetical protein JCM19037_3560 [Geomicrobium sp. JCM 19037]